MIIDASNLLLGRMATVVAKKALLGEKIDIVNCENALISGKRNMILAHYRHKKERGTYKHGPFFYSMPDKFVRRTIRGMLPYRTKRGLDAYKRIMCYIGVPSDFKSTSIETIQVADSEKLPILHTISVGEVCNQLGRSLK
ncbi:TPA: 50S ribosomal protein L13 [Candidatus Woesearchaeota archaeon]|nr:50S ribosomal protein L13 [Candidatus Woesearchaeota archaeon]